jgi:pimeloyl-ACP methyl ester carboxylesterase
MPAQPTLRQGFVELPHARLFYEIAGAGEPIVFLHGGLLDGRNWDDQLPYFAERYQAIRYDQRGSGRSETSAGEETYAPYQDLSDVLRALELPPATLVGLSGGARFAIDLAIAQPEQIRKLVLVSPGKSGYDFVDPWTHQRGAAMMEALSQSAIDDAVEIFLTMWTDGPSRSPDQVDPAVRERIRVMAAQSLPRSRLVPDFRELEPPAVGRLAAIKAPTLIVLGARDTPDIHGIGRLLQEQVALAELVMLPDVGHTLNMEKPSEFNALLDRFLAQSAVSIWQ